MRTSKLSSVQRVFSYIILAEKYEFLFPDPNVKSEVVRKSILEEEKT